MRAHPLVPAHQLQDKGAARADVGPARQEVAAHQRLQHAALAAGLAPDDRHLRQLQLEVQRHLQRAKGSGLDHMNVL